MKPQKTIKIRYLKCSFCKMQGHKGKVPVSPDGECLNGLTREQILKYYKK